MKVIDLLNKIAKGEEVPLKIKLLCPTLKDEYRNCTWNGSWYEYDADNTDVVFTTDKLELNDEIEIIEEDKKIRKIYTFSDLDDDDYAYEDGNKPNNVKIYNKMEELLMNKINEIIDYLEEKEQ